MFFFFFLWKPFSIINPQAKTRGWMGEYKCQLSVKILENFQLKTKTEKSKDYCKADHNNVYFFFITIFRLAIPAFFRFTDATEFIIGVTIFY